MRRHNLTFENFALERGQKTSRHAHKVGKNGQKVKKMNKSMNFPACTHKSKKITQSQQNFAPSHDGETVTFRNSALRISSLWSEMQKPSQCDNTSAGDSQDLI